MNPLQLIMIAINGLSVLTNNPAIVGSNLKLTEASELLSMLGELVQLGEEGYMELEEFAGTIQRMVDENREPTPSEWAQLRVRSDSAHGVIQGARSRAEEEEAEEAKEAEEAEATQKVADEIAALEALESEDLTDEQRARLEELTTPPESE